MITPLMSRPAKVLLVAITSIAAAGVVSACGTQKISVSPHDPLYGGAVLFSQRCSGCHTIAAAATHGSGTNIRTRELVTGPDFDTRCERPVTRVLYAIENGGFSGAVMPQNIVVGQDAIEVAKFVATYAGTQVAKAPGAATCQQMPFGTIPASSPTATTATTTTTTASTPAPTTKATTKKVAKKSRRASKK
jgi:mono/diheme cytochrome c family protein